MNIQKIKDFYTITEKDKYIILSDKHLFPLTEKPLIFIFGNREITTVEAAKANSNCIVTTCKDFYMEYFNITEEEFILQYQGLDQRTYKYLQTCKNNIGLTEYTGEEKNVYDMWEYVKLENTFNLVDQGFFKTEIEVGKIENLWCSQYCIQTAVDDYCIIKTFFTKKPNLNAITTARLLNTIELEFRLNRITFLNNCWECGLEYHWLDTEGSLSEKYDNLKEKYCGC
jgi:hypothetical protein